MRSARLDARVGRVAWGANAGSAAKGGKEQPDFKPLVSEGRKDVGDFLQALRLRDPRRRLGRVHAGQPAVGGRQQRGRGDRGGQGLPAGNGAHRHPQLLRAGGRLQPGLSLEQPARAALAQPDQPAGPAHAALHGTGPGHRRRFLDQRPDGQSRLAARLRRVGLARRAGLGLGRRAALFQEAGDRPGHRRRLSRPGRPDPGTPGAGARMDRFLPRRLAGPDR